MRRFNDSLAQGANLLADERQDLAAVLKNLNVALVEVRSFVHENRASLTSNISGLNQISKTLVKRRDALDEILRVAPAALNNLYLAGNVKNGTLDTRDNLGEVVSKLTSNPAETLCALVGSGNAEACNVIKQALGNAKLPRPKPFAGDPSAAPRVVEPIDKSMGGLMGGLAMTRRWNLSRLRTRAAAGLVALVSSALVLSGCSIYDAPLPGGPDTGKDPMTVTVMFRDVLDLVPQSTVKVDDVTVGKVKKVTLKGYVAKVTVVLPKDVDLPDNAEATIRQTSLLGEKFVNLAPPRNPSSNKLANGDVIGLDHSGRNPEVEEVLGALALLLNGGGVGQLKTIAAELNNAFGGRESEVRSVLDQIRVFTGTLDANKSSIVTALENTNRLAGELRKQDKTIKATLDDVPDALASINRPARRPGQAAQGADPAQQRRRQGDPGLEGVDDQQPALARAGAGRVRQGGAELPQVLPGLPDLPLRRRRGRPEPDGGPQPAHGRLHQPVGQPRPQPEPAQGDLCRVPR